MEFEQELMMKAEKRAKDKIGFYIHFACYVLVNLSLFIFYRSLISADVNLMPIMFGPVFGWGIGVAAHFISVFLGSGKYFDTMVKKEYESMKKTREK
ncbi:MAG: 2TM domain-containing protein [Candidatus Thermoplasmatota archaeon]